VPDLICGSFFYSGYHSERGVEMDENAVQNGNFKLDDVGGIIEHTQKSVTYSLLFLHCEPLV
jgi:hypothetical protein